jgi:hypothetical protein
MENEIPFKYSKNIKALLPLRGKGLFISLYVQE